MASLTLSVWECWRLKVRNLPGFFGGKKISLVLVPLYHIWLSHLFTSCYILWHLVALCHIFYWLLSHLLLVLLFVLSFFPTIVFLLRITLFQFRPKRGDDSDSECIPRDRLLQHRTLASVASGALDLGFRTEKIAEENPGTIWDAWLRSETWNIWNTVKWFQQLCQAILGMEMKVLLHDNDCAAES